MIAYFYYAIMAVPSLRSLALNAVIVNFKEQVDDYHNAFIAIWNLHQLPQFRKKAPIWRPRTYERLHEASYITRRFQEATFRLENINMLKCISPLGRSKHQSLRHWATANKLKVLGNKINSHINDIVRNFDNVLKCTGASTDVEGLDLDVPQYIKSLKSRTPALTGRRRGWVY